MSCCVGRRCSSDPVLLWLWCRPAAVALIPPLAWKLPHAAPAAVKINKLINLKNKGSWDERRQKAHDPHMLEISILCSSTAYADRINDPETYDEPGVECASSQASFLWCDASVPEIAPYLPCNPLPPNPPSKVLARALELKAAENQ